MPARDHEDVHRGLGLDVVESHDLFVLVGDLGGQLPRRDLAEDALASGHADSLPAAAEATGPGDGTLSESRSTLAPSRCNFSSIRS